MNADIEFHLDLPGDEIEWQITIKTKIPWFLTIARQVNERYSSKQLEGQKVLEDKP